MIILNYVGEVGDTIIFTSIFCMGLALVTLWEMWRNYPYLIQGNRKQKLLGLKRVPKLNKVSFICLAIVMSLALIAVSLHIFQFFLLCLSFCLYFLVYGQLDFIGRTSNLYPLILFFLAFVPLVSSSEYPSFTSDEWTIIFVKTTLSMVYFSSFVEKIKRGGQSWFNGSKLKSVMQYHDLLYSTSWYTKLARNNWFFSGASFLVLLFESCFWISIFFPQWDVVFGSLALLFHLNNYLFLKINYVKYYLPILAVYFI